MRDFTLGNIFQESTEILDSFIEILQINHWPVHEGNEFHKYHWPDIVLSERKLNFPVEEQDQYLDTDFLGAYFLQQIPNIGQLSCRTILEGKLEKLHEGFIVLYENTIIQCASKLSDRRYPNKEAIIELSMIVLIHEFAHWIILDAEFPKINKFDKSFFNKNYNTDQDVKNFHEGLAQYFTYYMIQNYKELLSIFLTLSGGQSGPYKKWKELCNRSDGKPKNIKVILMAILLYRELMTICPKFKSQSFENFKIIVVLIEMIGIDNNVTHTESIIEKFRNSEKIAKAIIDNNMQNELRNLVDESIWSSSDIKTRINSKRYGL